MRRAMLLLPGVPLLAWLGWSLRPSPPADAPTPLARPAPLNVPPSLDLLAELGLPDAQQYEIRVLDRSAHDLLIVYPKGVDPVATAARWSLAIAAAGYPKTNDWSRPGRTVLRFSGRDTSVLLAVGRTTEGPFVSCSHPAGPSHWALQPDEAAPLVLRPLLAFSPEEHVR